MLLYCFLSTHVTYEGSRGVVKCHTYMLRFKHLQEYFNIYDVELLNLAHVITFMLHAKGKLTCSTYAHWNYKAIMLVNNGHLKTIPCAPWHPREERVGATKDIKKDSTDFPTELQVYSCEQNYASESTNWANQGTASQRTKRKHRQSLDEKSCDVAQTMKYSIICFTHLPKYLRNILRPAIHVAIFITRFCRSFSKSRIVRTYGQGKRSSDSSVCFIYGEFVFLFLTG